MLKPLLIDSDERCVDEWSFRFCYLNNMEFFAWVVNHRQISLASAVVLPGL